MRLLTRVSPSSNSTFCPWKKLMSANRWYSVWVHGRTRGSGSAVRGFMGRCYSQSQHPEHPVPSRQRRQRLGGVAQARGLELLDGSRDRAERRPVAEVVVEVRPEGLVGLADPARGIALRELGPPRRPPGQGCKVGLEAADQVDPLARPVERALAEIEDGAIGSGEYRRPD